jgi:hypothetical protein
MTEYSIDFLNIENEKEMIQWAINSCPTFVYKSTKFVRDEKGNSLHKFCFVDEKDAMWFRLHWQ